MSLCHDASSDSRNGMLLAVDWIISTESLLSNEIFIPHSLRYLPIGRDGRICSLNVA